MKSFATVLSVGLAALSACGPADVRKERSEQAGRATTLASVSGVRPAGLLDTLRALLRQRNPAIDQVAFRDIRGVNYGRHYMAIGWGVRGDHTFRGSFEDELFTVLMLDSSLTHVVRVFEVLPSPRWLDFALLIEDITGDSLIVVGRGDTYGDGPIRRAYAWGDSL